MLKPLARPSVGVKADELGVLIDLVLRFTGFTHHQLCKEMGVSEYWILRIRKTKKHVLPSTARDIRDRITAVLEKEFDPFYCPTLLGVIEWERLCLAVKAFIGAEMDRIVAETSLDELVPLKPQRLSNTRKKRNGQRINKGS